MDLVAEAVLEVEAAFRDVLHPGEPNMLHPDCLGDHEPDIGALRGFSSWQSIPSRMLKKAV